jgi:hypothetical protein
MRVFCLVFWGLLLLGPAAGCGRPSVELPKNPAPRPAGDPIQMAPAEKPLERPPAK